MNRDLPIVQLDCVDYRQNGVEILRQVDWTLQQGQHWAVLGPNGSGKTTLLRITCGYIWPSAGRVRRFGRELIDLREMRRRIGWISNDLLARIPPGDTALDTVATGRLGEVGRKDLPTCGPSRQDYRSARDQMLSLGIQRLANQPFGVLSQGERQQVMFARSLMIEPMLTVLDEPCAGMDPGVRERFLAWLDEQAKAADGPAIVLVTHHVDEIVPSIEQTLVMSDGQIHAAGPTREVVTRAMLEDVYQTKVEQLVAAGGRQWPIWGVTMRGLNTCC